MGLPHSKALARIIKRNHFRNVLECGSPMPLFLPQNQPRTDSLRTLKLGSWARPI